jgi:hypothetical protein
MMSDNNPIYNMVVGLAQEDAKVLEQRDRSYGSSWEKRGGVGAFMMLARKWDRIEKQTERHAWDIFKAVEADPTDTGIIDDIRDLRRYLLLVEARLTLNQVFAKQGIQISTKDIKLEDAMAKMRELAAKQQEQTIRTFQGEQVQRTPVYEWPRHVESTYRPEQGPQSVYRPEDAARAQAVQGAIGLSVQTGYGRAIVINEDDGA